MRGQKVLSCGPDTLHLTYREGTGRSPEELSQLLGEFNKLYDIPTAAVTRDRGLSGFAAAAIDKAAGLRLDWTRPGEEGQNAGYFCLQVGGQWFASASGETQADFLQLLEAYGPLRATRLDFQQTVRTDSRLTPWWIKQFDSGALRVIGRKHYEQRGKKDHQGLFPNGATLYHGSRTSERYARQYDKHLQSGHGLPRRRDEIEVKGESCRNLWSQLHEQLLKCEQNGQPRGEALYTFSKRSIRAFLPIRDTSQWQKAEIPKHWSQMAPEPLSWSSLFDEDALMVKPREAKVTSLIKSYRYATQNFGAAVAMRHTHLTRDHVKNGLPDDVAYSVAAQEVVGDFYAASNEDRAFEFANEFRADDALELMNRFKVAKGGAEAMAEAPDSWRE